MPRYCEVALNVPLRTTFTYAIPAELDGVVAPGSRVAVPFRNRAMVGVVTELQDSPPEFATFKGAANKSEGSKLSELRIREIAHVLDPCPALTPKLIELGRWIASYYLAPPGDVFRAMLPPLVELRSERVLSITESGEARLAELASRDNRSDTEITEQALLELIAIEGKPLAASRLRKLPGGEAAAARLQRGGYLEAREISKVRSQRTQRIVAWNANAEIANGNGHKPSAAETRIRQVLAEEVGPIPLNQLLERAKASASVVERLIRQGKTQSWEEPLAPDESLYESEFDPPAKVLNADQERAVKAIDGWLDRNEFAAALLRGVTGSGKTEVYLRAAEATLARGKSAILLVPEIALTLQIGRLCRARFGEGVAVLHSALNDAERAREWWRVQRGEARIVVGTRSAVFAPVKNLGLIVVDEEHEASYKQEESPRYHGRDTAIFRAKLENAVALLGSATPSLESFLNARDGKYELLLLGERIGSRSLAQVKVVDMREDFRSTHRAGPFSKQLRDAITDRLAAQTQTLILINRRGYSWFELCRACGATITCENCSISLTYHKQRNKLICHYCGYTREVARKCPKCESEHVQFIGDGAERLEECLRELFPAARAGRLDRDTVRTKHGYPKILGAFAEGKLDILVGTQMVAKGHDFQRVTLVGVVSADLQLSRPDFRAAERTFQLLTQVAGRAGRGELPGEVLVETYYPEHYAIRFAASQDFDGFFEQEVHFRKMMHYPPFAALANILVRDRKIENAIRWSRHIAEFLAPAESRGVRVLGPAQAPLARLKKDYRFQFLLKSPKRGALNQVLSGCLDFCARKEIPDSAVIVDVDPLSLF
jgi:primosomal protein N' (replication factor Y) (superfamily II helicase)